MCDCSTLNPHLLPGEFPIRRPRIRGPSRCYPKATSPRGFTRGRGPEALRSKASGWGVRVPCDGSWVTGKISTFAVYPDPLPRGCVGVERRERNSIWVSGDYLPETYGSPNGVDYSGASDGGAEDAHPGPARKPLEDGDRSSTDVSAPSSFDVLELKRELEKEAREAGVADELEGENNLIPSEEFATAVADSEDESGADRIWGSRSGKQMLRRSGLIAKQVISVQSARSLGFISELWVDTSLWIVGVVEVRPNLLSGEIEKILLEDICQVGDVVLVQDESVMENELKMTGLDTLVGYNVMTSGRRNIGKVRGYNFNINSGAVASLELDSLGMSIIPASLVSTYCLMVEDVIEVLSDTVVVHEGAVSRLQRLTKGFWDVPKSEPSWDDIADFADFRRRTNRSLRHRSRGQHFSRQKFEDDWDLPMDF